MANSEAMPVTTAGLAGTASMPTKSLTCVARSQEVPGRQALAGARDGVEGDESSSDTDGCGLALEGLTADMGSSSTTHGVVTPQQLSTGNEAGRMAVAPLRFLDG